MTKLNKKTNEQRTTTFSRDEKTGNNVVHLRNRNSRNSAEIKICFFTEWPAYSNQNVTSYMATLDADSQLKMSSMQRTHIFRRDRTT